MVTVRDATERDRVVVCDLHVASVQELGPQAYDEAVVQAWAGDGDRDPGDYPIGESGVEFLVAERDDELAGFGEVRAVDPDDYDVATDNPGGPDAAFATDERGGPNTAFATAGEVRAVYVHPNHARQGVGTALLDELERRARRRGFDSLVLTASLNAVPFYEHHDYETVDELVHEFGGEVEGGAVVMRKSLD